MSAFCQQLRFILNFKSSTTNPIFNNLSHFWWIRLLYPVKGKWVDCPRLSPVTKVLFPSSWRCVLSNPWKISAKTQQTQPANQMCLCLLLLHSPTIVSFLRLQTNFSFFLEWHSNCLFAHASLRLCNLNKRSCHFNSLVVIGFQLCLSLIFWPICIWTPDSFGAYYVYSCFFFFMDIFATFLFHLKIVGLPKICWLKMSIIIALIIEIVETVQYVCF